MEGDKDKIIESVSVSDLLKARTEHKYRDAIFHALKPSAPLLIIAAILFLVGRSWFEKAADFNGPAWGALTSLFMLGDLGAAGIFVILAAILALAAIITFLLRLRSALKTCNST